MRLAVLAFVLLGMVFARQVVNVGESTDGVRIYQPEDGGADDADCYTQYSQCIRAGCAAAGGSFNELTQGCYGGDDARFAEAVGTCGDAHGECVMGASGQAGSGTSASETSAEGEGGLCGLGLVLLCSAGALFMGKV